MAGQKAVFQILTGRNERQEHVFCVLVKRSYVISRAGILERADPDAALRVIDHYYDNGDPEWATVQHENELAPCKPSVDVVVIGSAHAPDGRPVYSMPVSVRVGEREKALVVTGDRICHHGKNDPVFSEPVPFARMELRYERAYGGGDERSVPTIPFTYPRNPMGKGVALRNLKAVIEGLALPNVEDPEDFLTPERVILGEPERWHLQPLPQGFGWRQRTWYPRCALMGSYPAFTDAGTVTREERMGLLPRNHIALAKQFRLPTYDAQFSNGASYGMIFPRLKADETIALSGLSPTGPLAFSLPGDHPRIMLDIGRGARGLDSRLHTVSIRPDDRAVDLIWHGAYVYEGYSWWPQMNRPACRSDMTPAVGQTVVLPGQTPEGGHVLSLLLKRSYVIRPDGCVRAERDQPLLAADVPWGNPLNSTARFESDFVPFKLATDVVLNGRAYAPNGVATPSCLVAIQVGDVRKDVRVIGDRVAHFVPGGVPLFSEPVPFETMELRYERAYGGIDVYSERTTSYPYPRNPLGRGFVVANAEPAVDQLELPNLEDPADLLTPDRLCVGRYADWTKQPMPAGLCWLPKTAWPRAQYAGVLPADRATEQELRQAYAQVVPADQRAAYLAHGLPDMDFRFFNGASLGLSVPYLRGDEKVAIANLAPAGLVAFRLPGETPRLGLDIGLGAEKPDTVIHTVMIRMEENEVDIVWRAAVPYPGRDWLPQMRKMEIVVE